MTKRTIASLCVLLSCLSTVASAANPPKVVFIGDTGGWAPIFAAHPNWINKGTDPLNDPGGGYYGASDSIAYSVLQRFQTDVVAQHPDIVHIMCCWSDAYRDRDAIQFLWYSQYNEAMLDMIKAAKAANIKVILGTEPEGNGGLIRQENAWVEAYGAKNGIPVINYNHLLLDNEQFETEPGYGTGDQVLFNPTPPGQYPGPGVAAGAPTDAGYALIGVIVENVIETLGLTIKSGYLTSQNSYYTQLVQNPNFFGPNNIVKFIPFAVYSDGKTRPILNTNFLGASGIWTSTDLSVMNVDQNGYGTPVGSGKSRIWFQTFTGQTFSPFDVTVGLVCPDPIYCPY